MKRLLTVGALTLLSGYLALCVLLFTQQRAMLYPAPARTPTGALPEYLPDAGPVIVHFHGNAESAADVRWMLNAWKERGAGFVAVEYPGYAGVEGEPTERGLYDASERALQGVVARGIDKSRIVLVGQSLGTGPAVEMAKRGWGTRLVLLTPFTSIPDAAQRAFPWLPARWLVLDRYDSEAKAPGIAMPVLIVHGTRDEVVPYELGKRLAGVFPHAEFLSVDGAGHNDLWDRPEVVQRIGAFATGPL